MKQILNETYNVVQKTYTSKAGKRFLLVYVDPKTSSDSAFDAKEKFKEYGMQYLPSVIKSQYIPHAWGWVLWDGEQDKQMPLVKKFVNDLPKLETAPENGNPREFGDITSNLSETLQQILEEIEEADTLSVNNALDADVKERMEKFKTMVQNGLGNEQTQDFLKQIIAYRNELRKHNIYNLSWSNMILAFLARNGKATEVRPLKQWESMGYTPKQGIKPIGLVGKGCKHKRYTEQEKQKIINKYLADMGVNSIEELPPSSQYDLKNRKLKGRAIPGTEYLYTYAAYDRQDMEPKGDVPVEKEPEELENWWWDKLPKDEKDDALTEALIKFASSDECGNIVVKADNTQEGLGGARGNATSSGEMNLVDDEYMRFPTAVHELLHSLRHWVFASTNNPKLKRFYYRNDNRDVREQEAELCATFVISNYGYNVQPHLNYLKSWDLSKENCNKVFDQIADVANFIEKGVMKYLQMEEVNNQ